MTYAMKQILNVMSKILTKRCKHGIFSFSTNDMFIGKSLDIYGEYCENEFLIMDLLMQPNYIVLDVGANLGLHTVWFSKHAFTGKVHSFEPVEFNRQLLHRNLKQNRCKNVQVYSNAVSNRLGNSFISVFDPTEPGNYGECSLIEGHPKSNYQAVPTVPIDKLPFDRVDFIKIDVEGFEPQVLAGAEKTITKHRPSMLIEVNNSQPHIEKVWEQLNPKNYLLWWLPVRNYNPYNYFGNPVNIFANSGVVNVLACPQEKAPIVEIDKILEPVEGFDDNHTKMFQRVFNRIKKST